MRAGQDFTSLATYFGGLAGWLALGFIFLAGFNPTLGLVGVVFFHKTIYCGFALAASIFTAFIIYASRERIENYYFPARGFEESGRTLKATALNIWPVFLGSCACLLIYLYAYEGLNGVIAGTPPTAEQRQASILLLLPYTLAFAGFTATSALIAIKEAIRASRIAFGLEEAEGATTELTDRVLRGSSAVGSRALR
ncbi:MAG: hypothetical protein U0610_13245 [bacterium]